MTSHPSYEAPCQSYNDLENDGAERIDLEGDSSTYQTEGLGENQNVAQQNQQCSTKRVIKGRYSAQEKLDPRKVASMKKKSAGTC
jgi:hypothetical protein